MKSQHESWALHVIASGTTQPQSLWDCFPSPVGDANANGRNDGYLNGHDMTPDSRTDAINRVSTTPEFCCNCSNEPDIIRPLHHY
ncbi:MAG: hypothetical protein KME38_16155 [Spirirestis rafaelensis WJT71-NPBG6]|nr:hypothetical protein [Spirirestis rafaelensis WJT71-NPBG6]